MNDFYCALSRRICFLSGWIVMLSLQACASRPLLTPSATPYNAESIQSILNRLRLREQGVTTLFYTGKLTSKTRDSEVEATVSIVGRRTPFKARIEFTHPWGAPLAHLVVTAGRFKFLLFREKRLYEGDLKGPASFRYFPFLPDPDVIWGFIRAYPVISTHRHATSPAGAAITLLDRRGVRIQRLDIDRETLNPRACFYPGRELTLSFDNFDKQGSFVFAQDVEMRWKKGKKTLRLHIRQAIPNPTLPRAIFELKRPEGFKVIELSETAGTPGLP